MNTVYVTDVAPRDGLQNQQVPVSTEAKLELIRRLASAGVCSVEATSFVSPRAVPQMADAELLLPAVRAALPSLRASVLVPNLRGLERAREAGATEIAVVLSATETMNRRNINMGLEEAARVSEQTLVQARDAGLQTRAYVAVAFECPFEGPTSSEVVRTLAQRMVNAGAQEIVVADTIGAAHPRAVRDLMGAMARQHESDVLAIHLHDTRGMALANAWAALEAGVRRFDASVGGIGGCPFAPGAAGNLATEDLVLMAHACGFETGIRMDGLLDAVSYAETMLERPLGGRSARWLRHSTDRGSRRVATPHPDAGNPFSGGPPPPPT